MTPNEERAMNDKIDVPPLPAEIINLAADVESAIGLNRISLFGMAAQVWISAWQAGYAAGVESTACRCGEPAGPLHCDHCHNDPPRGHACPRCGIAAPADSPIAHGGRAS